MLEHDLLTKKYSIGRIILFITLILLLSHVFRNLTALYLLALFFFLFYSLLYCLKNIPSLVGNHLFYYYLAFVLVTFYVGGVSLIYTGFDSLSALPRLFLMPLSALIFYSLYRVQSLKTIRYISFIYLIFFVAASFSMILQLYVGPISWFSDHGSPRGGFERFSSFLGSLTIYGTSVQFAILISLVFIRGKMVNLFVLIILIIGAAMSLQKAAVVNVILSFVIYFYVIKRFNIFQVFFLVFSCLISGIFLVSISSFIFPGNVIASYIDVIIANTFGFQFFTDNSIPIDDSLTSDRIIERLGILAFDIFEFHDPVVAIIFGIGVIGAGSGMGIPGPQAHNTIYDVLFMGGLFYFLTFIFLFGYILIYFYKMSDLISRFYKATLVLIIFNLPFASAFIYHPVTSFLFWSAIGYGLYRSSLPKILKSNELHQA